MVVLDERGISNFQRLQQLGESRRGLTYFAFDLLAIDGQDLRKLSLEERKTRLKKLLGKRSIIRYSPHFEGSGAEVFAQACRLGAEGIISKRRKAPYRSGTRSLDWQKIKCVKRQELVVGGFTDPDGSRIGIGSLLVGYYEGDSLRFAGKVGTGPGWNEEFGRSLRRKLERIETGKTPFDPPPKGWLGKHAHWVRPRLVAEVEFSEWTSDGSVRHPSLQGFRRDKKPGDVRREIEVDVSAAEPVALSRSVYPRMHLDTSDLVTVYSDIMEWALPHVEGRPLTLVRMREPITRGDALRSQAECVHHTMRDQRFVPADVPRIRIAEKHKVGEYRYVDSAKALLALIASGVVEWHVWNARVDDVERPDRIILDIDPGDGVAWQRVVEAARRTRTVLEDLSLESWVKTTGGKGLHVVVPFRAEHDWETAFNFSRGVGARMVDENPGLYTLSFDKDERRGKILIDYKRNYRTSIAIAGFSLRAMPNAPIGVPLRWEELGRVAPDAITARNIRARLARRTVDPWKSYWTTKQRLRQTAIRALAVTPP